MSSWNCEQTRQTIDHWIDLDPSERERTLHRMLRHHTGCTSCRGEVEFLQQLELARTAYRRLQPQRPAPRWERGLEPVTRRKAGYWIALAASLIVVASVAGWWLTTHRLGEPDRGPTRVTLAAAMARGERSTGITPSVLGRTGAMVSALRRQAQSDTTLTRALALSSKPSSLKLRAPTPPKPRASLARLVRRPPKGAAAGGAPPLSSPRAPGGPFWSDA